MTGTHRWIDHLVLATRNLRAARERFADFGFTVTPPAKHPFGTGNTLVQLRRNFIELLAVVEPEKLVPMTAETFSFGAFNADFLERREGLSMLVFSSDDAVGDAAAWAERGLPAYEPVHFARKARLPDGEEATVAFTIAFAIDRDLPEAAYFVCQQHAPEHFWQPRYQHHANGATRIAGVTLVVERPVEHAAFFEAMLGEGAVQRSGSDLRIDTADGRLEVLAPRSAAGRFAHQTPGAVGRFVGFSVAVHDLEEAAALLRDTGVPYVARDESLEIGPETACGAILELVPEES